MAAIHAIAAASAAAVDSVHAEQVRLEPMIEHQYSGRGADPSRTIKEISAPLISDRDLLALDTKGRGDADRFGGGAQTLFIHRAIWPEETDLRKGDVVVALDRPGEPRFAVDNVDKRQRARIVVHLSGLGHA
ncbi:MAG: hypothetical protein KKB37_11325 [Alphaproteobacteria bacterium]|nr:hypothetical protein [Alphaproteobacteria bacterium]